MKPGMALRGVLHRAAQIRPVHLPDGLLTVVVFGPGRGEAIVVRTPDGRVSVVDGCRENDDPVLALLRAMAGRVALGALPMDFVCLTHAHDDHYLGQGSLLAACPQAQTVWPPALGDRLVRGYLEYLKLRQAQPGSVPDQDPGHRGLARLVEQWQRHARVRKAAPTRELLRREVRGHTLSVRFCGPPDQDIRRSEEALIERLHRLRDGQEDREGRLDPNDSSSALLIEWGRASVLLAGDLLGGTEGGCGWSQVHAEGWIQRPVQVVNVAHHASEPAHHPELWRRMAPQLAIVTPFQRALRSQPPRPEMIRTLSQSCAVVITSPPAWYGQPGTPTPLRGVPGARPDLGLRSALPGADVVPAEQPADVRNAVAVSLDESGALCRVVLAGKADLYEGGE